MMISCPVATSADLIGSAAGPAPYHLDEESHRATGVIEFLPLRDLGTQRILRVLQHTHGKIRPAAHMLGITRWSLARRLRKRAGGFAYLVQATVGLGHARPEAETRTEEPPLHIWARIVPPIGKGGSTLHRADWLTPYAAETIAAHALRAGRGARLDVTVAASATVADLAGVREQFAHLVNQAVKVSVRLDDQPGPNASVWTGVLAPRCRTSSIFPFAQAARYRPTADGDREGEGD